MLTALDDSKLSPEQLGKVLGISGMTLRRWRKERPSKKVSQAYEKLVIEGVYQLIVDGHLDAEMPSVRALLKSTTSLSFAASIKSMGVTVNDLDNRASEQDRFTEVLSRIGLSETHRQDVDRDQAKINSFKKMGRDWKRYITTLVEVVKSTELSMTEKFVAYGALFYLIYPFDLIPDHLPIVGLMDDFAVLGIATSFYVNCAKKKGAP